MRMNYAMLFSYLRFAAGGASASAVLAIACQDGVVKRVIAKRRTPRVYQIIAKPWTFAVDAVIASVVYATVMKRTIFDIPDNTAKNAQ